MGLGSVPEEWRQSYVDPSLSNSTLAIVASDADAAAPIELFNDVPSDLLVDMVEMHSDGIPVNWPTGLNVFLATIAIQHRR